MIAVKSQSRRHPHAARQKYKAKHFAGDPAIIQCGHCWLLVENTAPGQRWHHYWFHGVGRVVPMPHFVRFRSLVFTERQLVRNDAL